MKATLEFELPEDEYSYDIHKQAVEMSIILAEFYQYIRGLYKHGHTFKDADEAVDVIRNRFVEECGNLIGII